jgi:hypothetical protein
MKTYFSFLAVFILLSNFQIFKPSNLQINEDFNTFQASFFTDSLFQIERINFPLTVQQPYAQPGRIAKSEWSYKSHLHWNSESPYDVHFSYISAEYSGGDEIVHGKVDTGKYEDYSFSLENGKWYLVKIFLPAI